MSAQSARSVEEPARRTPVAGEYDVLVVGGGVAGIAAALSAKRAGAPRVALLEREFALGGLATLGLVTIYLPLCDGRGRQVSFGLAEELLALSVSLGAEEPVPDCWRPGGDPAERARRRYRCQFSAGLFLTLAEQRLLAEGIEILYGVGVSGVVAEGGALRAVLGEGKDGRCAYLASAYVDATGDADVLALAGERTERFRQGNVLASWYYTAGGDGLRLHALGACDVPDSEKAEGVPDARARYGGLCTRERSRMMSDSRRNALEDYLAEGGFAPGHALAMLPALPQLRMTRRLAGSAQMRLADAFRETPDSVGLIGNWKRPGPVYEVPLAALCARTPNLYASGRCIAAEEDMWDVTRVIPCCAVTGEAAGVAAAVGRDAARVQAVLRSRGIPLHARELPPL